MADRHGTESAQLGLGAVVTNVPSPHTVADNSFENVEFVEGGTVPAGSVGTAELADASVTQVKLATGQRKREARSVWFNLDNGAGTTVDDVILKLSVACTILAARIIYVDATTGTVAAGNARIGTTLGGSEIVAATAYADAAAVGTSTAMTIVSGAVSANGSVFVRHTGVAATQAGQAVVEIEYTID